MRTLVLEELIGTIYAGVPQEAREAATAAAERCVYRGTSAMPRHYRCEKLSILCGNSVAVSEQTCAACRACGTYEPETNGELANCVCHVAWSRFFPEAPREIVEPEAEGERDALVAAVKRCRGVEMAKALVDTMYAAGLFAKPEDAVELCLAHGLVEP